MASNGLLNRAKNGKCRICFRHRNVNNYLKPVKDIVHGFAIGHHWECKDKDDCIKTADERIFNKHPKSSSIIQALELFN